MGQFWDEIPAVARKMIAKQHVFFLATSPLAADGHINVSPKGHCQATFAVISDSQVAYLDLTGSGVETIAHVKENGRIVFMFCNFAGDAAPCILRLWGKATVHEKGTPGFDTWLEAAFPPGGPARAAWGQHPGFVEGARSVIVADITKVSTSCGYAVPVMDYKQDRDSLLAWSEKKTAAGIRDYQLGNNTASLDGLPGLSEGGQQQQQQEQQEQQA